MKADDILQRYDTLKADKEVYETLYQEVADYFLPFKADFNRLYSAGEKRNRELYSQLPQHSVDVSSSSLIGLLANPASRWFYVEMIDEKLNRDAGVADWCEKAGQTLLNYVSRPEARFYESLKSALEDALVFGTPSMFCNPNEEVGLEFGSKAVHSFVIAEDHRGIVDTVFNEHEYTARQIMQRVDVDGWEASKDLAKLAEEKPDEKVEVIHAIMPRKDAKKGKDNPKVLPIAGYYVDKKHRTILKETGYHEFPQPVARWRKVVVETYGRSQAMIALADAQTLNVAMRMFMMAVEKQLQPMVFLPNDTNPNNVDFTAGGVTFYDATKGRPEFYSGVESLQPVFEFIKMLEDKINSTMYVDQLQLTGNADMTATEVLQRQNEKARLLAPALGRIQTELLAPLLTRALNIGIRDGWIEFPPEQLAGQEFQVTFSTPITRAQREVDMDNINFALQALAQTAQFRQLGVDRVDFDKIEDEIMDIRGVTGIMKLDDAQIEEIRAQAAQQAQMQQAMAVAQQGAEVAKTANDAGILQDITG